MIFRIDFNRENNDKILIEKLGAYYVDKGRTKYPPFEELMLEVKDFNQLQDILNIIDKEPNDFYSAVISFDPPTIFLDNKA